ncbi:hypothetical protein O6H91_19G084400 [Diphasiastrum complanatum]|uniref:Uncharacterized protein n=1 Tax=Diphasiastrum complanatum TaxID=34168 RepID=A0ACC2AXF9_DIPCM|nr:hypothetical protein O6H91_19G084400 [Diphasiastrum complanatum]
MAGRGKQKKAAASNGKGSAGAAAGSAASSSSDGGDGSSSNQGGATSSPALRPFQTPPPSIAPFAPAARSYDGQKNLPHPTPPSCSSSNDIYNPFEHTFKLVISDLQASLTEMQQRVNTLEIYGKAQEVKISMLEERNKAQEATISQMQMQIAKFGTSAQPSPTLEKEVELSKSWASLFKTEGNVTTLHPNVLDFTFSTFYSEQEKREKKAMNIRVRGCPNVGEALEQAKGCLRHI